MAQTSILGLGTNVAFLRALLADADVQTGKLDTGLVARTSDDGDRRAAWVSITASGHGLAEQMRQERTAVVNEGLAGLPEAHRRVLEQAIPALESLAEQLRGRPR